MTEQLFQYIYLF